MGLHGTHRAVSAGTHTNTHTCACTAMHPCQRPFCDPAPVTSSHNKNQGMCACLHTHLDEVRPAEFHLLGAVNLVGWGWGELIQGMRAHGAWAVQRGAMTTWLVGEAPLMTGVTGRGKWPPRAPRRTHPPTPHTPWQSVSCRPTRGTFHGPPWWPPPTSAPAAGTSGTCGNKRTEGRGRGKGAHPTPRRTLAGESRNGAAPLCV